MISDKSSLASRLGWVMADTEQAIVRAQESFARFSASGDRSELSASRETCRQLNGVLEILAASGAHMLCQEIVKLLDALIQERVENLAAAHDAVAEGLLQLVGYLKHLQEGYADLPVIVLPTLNNLRAARDVELLSEHLVFLPEAGHASDAQIGTSEYLDLSADKRQQVTAKLRFFLQKALLGWFRHEQPERMLQAAGKVADNMIRLHQSQRLRALWWISAGLAAALETNRLEHGVAVKMLMGRLEREIRRFGEQGELRYERGLSDELLKNLLYYVGIAENGTELTDKVKAAYHLDLYLPQGATLEELRHYYTTPGRDLWRTVAGSVTEELRSLQSLLEGMQQTERQAELLQQLVTKTASLSSTLAMLGLGRAAELTGALCADLQQRADSGAPQDLDTVLNISTHYARLEKVLAEYAETGHDLTDSIFSLDAEGIDPSGERSLLRTALTEISKAQARMVAFYKDNWALTELEEAIAALESISGALVMVGSQELLPLVETALRYAREDLLANQREPTQEELAVFADILTLFEACVAAHLQHEDYLALLPTGFAKLRELDGFSPLNLLQTFDLDTLEAAVETKKKARPLNSQTLLRQIRQPNLRTASLALA